MQDNLKWRLNDYLILRNTQLEMLQDRGYDITAEESILTMSYQQFIEYINMLVPKTNTTIRSALSQWYISKDNAQR